MTRKRQPGNYLSIRNGDRLTESVTSWSPGPLSRGPALRMVPSGPGRPGGCLSRLCDTPALGSLEVGVTSWVAWDIAVATKPLPEGGSLPPCLQTPARRLTRGDGEQGTGEGAVALATACPWRRGQMPGSDRHRPAEHSPSLWENNPRHPSLPSLRGPTCRSQD